MGKEQITALLNQTGSFFHDYCAELLRSLPLGLSLRTEEPFTYPPSNGPLLGLSGSMDLLAVYADSRKSFCFSIECKRVLPDAKCWVFFKTKEDAARAYFVCLSEGPTGTHVQRVGLTLSRLAYTSLDDYELCNRVFELNEDLKNLNKRREEKAYRSLLQANHGLVATLVGKRADLVKMSNGSKKPMYFVPIVLTTARLYLAKFDSGKIDVATGQVLANGADYEEKRWIECEFGLPDYLASPTGDLFRRRSTFVVNSLNVREFFENIVFPDGF